VRFREDILRGVRLFAIVFATILLCVAGYRILRASDVQSAAPAEVMQPSPEPTPEPAQVSDAAPEVHPLVVPEPPPVGGRGKAGRARNTEVPPPPPVTTAVVRPHRPSPSGKEFEASDAVKLPAAPVEVSPETKALTTQERVGYKSLIDANKNRPAVELSAPPADDYVAAPEKGNRFFKAIGKIFHPGGKKETEPSALQPKQP
jgi:hypothetical protein